MFVYSVKCNVDVKSSLKWEQYFLEKHLDDVFKTGCFTGYNFRKEIDKNDSIVVFISEYYCASLEALKHYNENFASALKKDILKKFSGKFSAKRSTYKILNEK